MEYKIQSASPVIKLYHFTNNKKDLYHIFSASDKNNLYSSGQNLQNYSFQRSTNTLTGSFSLTVKEDVKVLKEDDYFMNKVSTFDLVEIYEKNEQKLDFMGIITSVSYNADASSLSKYISIQGKSAIYLLDSLNICMDVTAMAISETGIQSEMEDILLTAQNYTDSVKTALQEVYNKFIEIVKKKATNVSNSGLVDFISLCFNTNNIVKVVPDNLEFVLPLVSTFFNNSVVTYPQYIQGYFDSNIYELFENIENGKQNITLRLKPFDFTDWNNLKTKEIKAIELVSYTFSKSIDQVYTTFYSSIEGSEYSAEYYVRANDKNFLEQNNNKLALYGYKPLRATFSGYQPNQNKDLGIKFKELNKKLRNWYENLDEMYSGTITVINLKDEDAITIGNKLSFIGGEFYITGEDHQWNYGSSPRIIYHVERGGEYKNGKFSMLKNITKPLNELEKTENGINGVM